MKILVTGGCGFIGSHIVDEYIKKGHRVFVIDDLSTGRIKNLNPRAHFLKADICDKIIEKSFRKEKFDIINHHAAQINVRTSIANPLYDARVNILGTLHLLALAAKYEVTRFIFASSGGAIYGEPERFPISEDSPILPIAPYGIAKASAEKYLLSFAQTHDFAYVILRYSNVYGPRQISSTEAGVISIFVNHILKNETCTVFGSGNQVRDYVYVEDVVQANVCALKCQATIANIGTSIGTNVNDLIDILGAITGKKVRHIHGQRRPGEVFKNMLDYRKAKKVLGWQPRTKLRRGMALTFQYFKELAN